MQIQVLCPKKGIQRLDRGENPRTVAQKCTQEIHPKTALIWLDWGANSGIVSQKMHHNCTYTFRSGCKSRAIVPKLHPNFSEASKGDDIVVSWQGDGRLLNNLETREANKKYGKPKKRSVTQAEDMLGKPKKFTLNTVELPR